MPLSSDYSAYIFDCDGVIFDSNDLKITAMKRALEEQFSESSLIESCINYFSENFGMSRFHHISYFLDEIFDIDSSLKSEIEKKILNSFSLKVKHLYLSADLTPGFMQFLNNCNGRKFVASGSEQNELRAVFKERKIDQYFDGIFGSPTPKSDLINIILKKECSKDIVMIGDAESDMLAAQANDIDFVFYYPYSNVKTRMNDYCSLYKYKIIHDFQLEV